MLVLLQGQLLVGTGLEGVHGIKLEKERGDRKLFLGNISGTGYYFFYIDFILKKEMTK